ncbi:glycosyltransferase family 2 protein [Aliiroseovarius sp. F20344]|uniref:glycosyltransferase family 2 protein n=1 Tax=Aliiroseovarius sp. F20344 TaxID=2926414 RepID=UPI001FF2EC1F|nr:glycosyltransferase family 2 protein [Aliiroseovarius sp. F20344]MCK0141255.1 glycosyltransferase family 2 protein [Aliiroseovarius sp. F20344]
MHQRTLITAARNEGPYLVEWIAWHRMIGFDQIVVFDEPSQDQSTPLLDALAKAGVITRIDNADPDAAMDHTTRALNKAVNLPEVQGADWAMVLDVDEFLMVHTGDGSLDALLDATPEAQAISPCWRYFGDSGLTTFTDAPVTLQFTYAAPDAALKDNPHPGIKTLFRPAVANQLKPHRPILREAFQADPNFIWVNGSGDRFDTTLQQKGWRAPAGQDGRDLCEVHHYKIRSTESFVLQSLGTTLPGSDTQTYDASAYARFNCNEQHRPVMLPFTTRLAAQIETLMALPGVRDAHQACITIHADAISEMRTGLDLENPKDAVLWALLSPTPDQAEEFAPDDIPAVKHDDAAPRWLADLRRSKHRKGFYQSLPKCALQFSDRSSDILIVSFDNLSNVNDPALSRETWGYPFYRDEGWSHLGVLAFERYWYRDDDLFDAIEKLAKDGFFKGYKNVVLTGTSMGAYAATAFADLIPGCTVLAFSPQSTLHEKLVPWEERFNSGRKQDWSGRYADATRHCSKADQVFVVYDPYFEPDAKHAARYEGANIRFLKSWYSSHKSALFLRRAKILKQIMRDAVARKLTPARYYALYRTRRDLPWFLNGLADRLHAQGRDRLALRLAGWLSEHNHTAIAHKVKQRHPSGKTDKTNK